MRTQIRKTGKAAAEGPTGRCYRSGTQAESITPRPDGRYPDWVAMTACGRAETSSAEPTQPLGRPPTTVSGRPSLLPFGLFRSSRSTPELVLNADVKDGHRGACGKALGVKCHCNAPAWAAGPNAADLADPVSQFNRPRCGELDQSEPIEYKRSHFTYPLISFLGHLQAPHLHL